MMRRHLEPLLGTLFALWFLAVYAPGVRGGFIRDDFTWIGDSTVSSLAETVRFLHPSGGFFRPLVSLSFAADRALFGLARVPYALTNLLVLLLGAVAVFLLARAFRLGRAAGVAAAGLWLLNPYGINTTLLWTSGRTATLLTLFAVLAALAFKRGRPWLTALLALLAMLSKEEAALLPFVFAGWAALDDADEPTRLDRVRRALRSSWIPFLALAAYLVLRNGSGAITPRTAPPGYRLTLALPRIGGNLLEYAHRTCFFPIVLVGALALVGRARLEAFSVPRNVFRGMVIWVAGLYALTVFLPLRSGLYVVAPSVGTAVLAGACLANLVEGVGGAARRRVWSALVAAVAFSLPVYWARNAPDLRRAELTSAILPQLAAAARDLPRGGLVVIHDHRDGPATMEDAFGTLTPEAVALFSGRRDVTVWLDPTPFDLRVAGVKAPDESSAQAVFALQQGELKRVR